jgi:hypothetical protein
VPDRRPPAPASPFHVPLALHVLGGLVHRHPRVWLWLGRRESAQLADELARRPVRAPIFVCGLARSGSTLLHEAVAAHPGVATHRVKDYPLVFTPYWWRRATTGRGPGPARERAHHDRVMVTPDSPDALEEMVWAAFFPRCHDPATDNRLGRGDRHPAFESFYDAHLRKLMLAEGADRYAAKANYHVTRIPYLLRLYPDARLLVPVREPAAHVASLAHQHRWFSHGQRAHPRLLSYMRWSGHFEFGLDRRPMHLGDDDRARAVRAAWDRGDEVRGLAMYWDMVYRSLADLIATDDRVRAAVRPVRYEDVRATPAETLRAALDHCGLPEAGTVADRLAGGIRAATTTPADLSAADRAVIEAETRSTAARWGY